MIQDEQAQFAEIKKMMISGDFDQALAQLQTMNSPKARQWISEIQARQPLKSSLPPMPVDDLTQAERLIAQSKFDDAEALLRSSEHSSAQLLLQKLTQAQQDHSSASELPLQKRLLSQIHKFLKREAKSGSAR
jgi:hypothetical protein